MLAAALSTEVKTWLSQRLVTHVQRIGTTAFTDKPVSMKYRGVFDLAGRKPGKLNYVGAAGRWSLAEGLQWWLSRHATR